MKIKFLALLLAIMLAFSCASALAEPADETGAAEAEITAEPAEAAEDDGWWNVLLLGDDARSTTRHERTDCIILFSINREESQVKMTSIMRDTWVKISGHGSGKINAANVYGGPELAVETVSSSFDVDIDNYILVNMHALVNIIDRVGGVDVDVSESERKYINQYARGYLNSIASYDGDTTLDETGLVHLNGLLAMSYCRNRYTDSDYGRVMRQQEVLIALAEAMQNMEINDLMKMSEDFTSGMVTDLDNEQLKELATAALATELSEVQQFRLPADGAFTSGTFSGTWMIRPDLEKNAQLLNDFIYNDAPVQAAADAE